MTTDHTEYASPVITLYFFNVIKDGDHTKVIHENEKTASRKWLRKNSRENNGVISRMKVMYGDEQCTVGGAV